MRPAIARSIVFNSFDLAIAGRIAAVKSRDPFLSWVYLNKKLTVRRNGRSVMFKCLRDAQDVCQAKKMLVQRYHDPRWVAFWAQEFIKPGEPFNYNSTEPICFNPMSGETSYRARDVSLEDLSDLQCIRIAYALTFLYVHETKSVMDGQACNVREMFVTQSIL